MATSIKPAGEVALALTLTPASAGTLDKTKSDKKVTLGYRDSSVPFPYLDDSQ